MKKLYFLLFLAILVFIGIFVFLDSAKAQTATLYDNSGCSPSDTAILVLGNSGSDDTNDLTLINPDSAYVSSGCVLTLFDNTGAIPNPTSQNQIVLGPGTSTYLNVDNSYSAKVSSSCTSVTMFSGEKLSPSPGSPISIPFDGNCHTLTARNASSVQIAGPSSCTVTLYSNSDSNCTGSRYVTLGPGASSSVYNINDAAQSAILTCAAADGYAKIWQNEGASDSTSGHYMTLGVGTSTNLDFFGRANSIRLTSGYFADLYPNSTYLGAATRYNYSSPPNDCTNFSTVYGSARIGTGCNMSLCANGSCGDASPTCCHSDSTSPYYLRCDCFSECDSSWGFTNCWGSAAGNYSCQDGCADAGKYAPSADQCCSGETWNSATRQCVANTCQTQGTSCDATHLCCGSLACADGVCCNNSCSAACQNCNLSGHIGTCWPIANGSTNLNTAKQCINQGTTCGGVCDGNGACRYLGTTTSCTPTTGGTGQCDGIGNCVAKYVNGHSCNNNAECNSGYCVDGVCCNSICSQVCQSCNQTSWPASLGTCWNIPNNQDPDNECNGTGTCGGTCNGLLACQFPGNSTSCGTGMNCDGNGNCVSSGAGVITVTSPNGTENWSAGSSHNITWTCTGVSGSVNINLYKGGANNSSIGSQTCSLGTYSWSIPASTVTGSDYQVYIVNGTVSDLSNGDFSIGGTCAWQNNGNCFTGGCSGGTPRPQICGPGGCSGGCTLGDTRCAADTICTACAWLSNGNCNTGGCSGGTPRPQICGPVGCTDQTICTVGNTQCGADSSCGSTPTPTPTGSGTPTPTPHSPSFIEFPNFLNFDNIQDLINKIIDFILTLAIAIAPIIFIYGGFLFISAAGSPEKINNAKRVMLYAGLGLAVALFAWGLISVIKNLIGVK